MAFALLIDGQAGPQEVRIDLTDHWRVLFRFGRTENGVLRVLSLTIEPHRPDGVVPDEDGVTVALVQRVRFAGVRRYLEGFERTVKQKQQKPERAPEPKRGRPTTMTAAKYQRLVKERQALVGDPHPSKTLASRWKVNRSTMRTWLTRANERSQRSARNSAHR